MARYVLLKDLLNELNKRKIDYSVDDKSTGRVTLYYNDLFILNYWCYNKVMHAPDKVFKGTYEIKEVIDIFEDMKRSVIGNVFNREAEIYRENRKRVKENEV